MSLEKNVVRALLNVYLQIRIDEGKWNTREGLLLNTHQFGFNDLTITHPVYPIAKAVTQLANKAPEGDLSQATDAWISFIGELDKFEEEEQKAQVGSSMREPSMKSRVSRALRSYIAAQLDADPTTKARLDAYVDQLRKLKSTNESNLAIAQKTPGATQQTIDDLRNLITSTDKKLIAIVGARVTKHHEDFYKTTIQKRCSVAGETSWDEFCNNARYRGKRNKTALLDEAAAKVNQLRTQETKEASTSSTPNRNISTSAAVGAAAGMFFATAAARPHPAARAGAAAAARAASTSPARNTRSQTRKAR